MLIRKLVAIGFSLLLMSTLGCGDPKDGDVTNEIELPTDTALRLECDDVGIYPNTCILDDSENPYAMVNVTEDNRFELSDVCPTAKSRFFLWATALAKGAGPPGENQFFTARALHELFTEGGSVNAREQAKRAYRAVLDQFFDSATYFQVDYLPEEPTYPVPLKDLVGENLWDPSRANLNPLYSEPEFAAEALGEWGYALVVVLQFEYDDITGEVIDIIEKRIVQKLE